MNFLLHMPLIHDIEEGETEGYELSTSHAPNSL